jgi:hypothetical protein
MDQLHPYPRIFFFDRPIAVRCQSRLGIGLKRSVGTHPVGAINAPTNAAALPVWRRNFLPVSSSLSRLFRPLTIDQISNGAKLTSTTLCRAISILRQACKRARSMVLSKG